MRFLVSSLGGHDIFRLVLRLLRLRLLLGRRAFRDALRYVDGRHIVSVLRNISGVAIDFARVHRGRRVAAWSLLTSKLLRMQ